LAVINPLYKLMMDGTFGIRVDNPAEVQPAGSGTVGQQCIAYVYGSWLLAQQYCNALVLQ
jgi:hypothetical protein